MGSDMLAGTGADIVCDYRNISVTGLSEVISHAGHIKRAFDRVKAHIASSRPDLVILVDFPGFNMRIARFAKTIGIPVIYFIPPQIWAWNRGRIKKIRRYVDRVICILPFEKEFYGKAGVEAVYIGHPFTETVKPSLDREEFIRSAGIKQSGPILTIMPGSRKNEVSRHLPVLSRTVGIMRRKIPGLSVLLPLADNIDEDYIRPFLDDISPVFLIKNGSHNAMAYCDTAIIASGSATLEAALLKTPTLIIYRISWLSYAIARLIVHVDFIGLPNIIAGKEIFPEFIQHLRPEMIANRALSMINKGRQDVEGELTSIIDKLRKQDSYHLASTAVTDFLETIK